MKRALWLCLFTAFGLMCWSQEQTQPTRTPVLKLTLLGTGGPAPRVERFGPSTLVQAGDKLFLFDCGRGSAQRLFQLGVLRDANALFLTHLHSDHVVGIPDLWLTGWFEGRSTALRVWGPTGTRDMMSHLRHAYEFDVQVRSGAPEHLPSGGVALTAKDIEEGAVYDDGAVKIESFNVDHGGVKPAFGYKIQYAGHSVVISGDTRPSENLVRFAKGADVLIHCAVVVSEARRNSQRTHAALQLLATAEEAGQVFDRVKPRLALYTHYNTAEDLVAQTRKTYSGPLEVGEDLLTVEIGDQIQVQRRLGRDKSAAPSQAEQEILGLEEERRQAILHNDAAAMDRLLGAEFVVTDVRGRVHDKADEVALYRDARRRTESWEPSDVKVRVYADATVVTERAAVKDVLEGERRDIQLRLTHVWVKRDGRWQVVARQATRISESPSAAASVTSRQNWTAPPTSSTEPSSAAELPSKSKAEKEVRQAERELTEALSQGNFATVERIYADDYSLVTVNGELQNKAQRIAALRATDPKSVTRNRDDIIVRVSGDTVVVTGRTLFSTQAQGSQGTENRRFTHIWAKRRGRWQMVTSQVTRIAGEAASQQDRTPESEAAASRVIDAFNVAGNKHDVEGLRNALNFPYSRIAGGKVSIARTREEFASDGPPQWREEGWHHSTVDSVEFIQSSSDKVHAAVVFSRYKADGTRYATYRTLRIITKQNGHWGIQCSSSFAP